MRAAAPYVGPRPFDLGESEKFYGRDEEIAIVASLVMTSRATLFYAQSGAGKSSAQVKVSSSGKVEKRGATSSTIVKVCV